MKKNLKKLVLIGVTFSLLMGLIVVTINGTEDPKPWTYEHIELFL